MFERKKKPNKDRVLCVVQAVKDDEKNKGRSLTEVKVPFADPVEDRGVTILYLRIESGLEAKIHEVLHLILQKRHEGLDDDNQATCMLELLLDKRDQLEAA